MATMKQLAILMPSGRSTMLAAVGKEEHDRDEHEAPRHAHQPSARCAGDT